jgi:hypothetical protein
MNASTPERTTFDGLEPRILREGYGEAKTG